MTTTYIRHWCPACFQDTTHYRYGDEDILNAQIECAEHGQPRGGLRVIDWPEWAVQHAHRHGTGGGA